MQSSIRALALSLVLTFTVATFGGISSAVAQSSELPVMTGWEYSFTDDELETAWSWKATLKPASDFETRVVFHYQDPQNYALLRIVGNGAKAQFCFWRVSDGKLQRWGEPENTINISGAGELTLQRTPWRARALWNGQVVTAAYGSMEGEGFSVQSKGAVKLSETRMQPTEPAFLSDDFMRAGGPDEPEVESVWQPISGEWKTSGLLNKRADSSRNPNPFVYRAEAKDKSTQALAKAGYWWWNDYTVMASLRPAFVNRNEPLQAGLTAYAEREDGGVTGFVDFTTRRASISIGGRVVATGEPFAIDAGQWHRLFLDPGPGTMRLLVNGVERVRAGDAELSKLREPAQGPAALTSRVGGANYVDYDDVRVAPNNGLRDNFSVAAVGRWNDELGTWQTQTARGARAKLTDGPAITLTGEDDRSEGHMEAVFAMWEKTPVPVGAVFGARDAQNYLAARLRAGRLEIVEYSDGAGRLLAVVPNAAAAPQSQPQIEVEWSEGIIKARSGDATATAVVAEIPAGRVGVWADGAGKAVGLSSFRALGAAPGWGEAALPEVFQKDRLMKYWASNAQAWSVSGDDDIWWHTGDFFRDAALEIPLPDFKADKRLSLLLAADPGQTDTGARLEITRQDENLAVKLFEAGREVKTAALALSPEQIESLGSEYPPLLRVARRPLEEGRVLVRAALDEEVILNEIAETQSTQVASAHKIGVRLGDASDQPTSKNLTITVEGQKDSGQMGIGVAAVTPDIQRERALPDTKGAYVQRVAPNLPAAQAGLQSGDVIRAVKLGDKTTPVENFQNFLNVVKEKKPEEKIELHIYRSAVQTSAIDWEQVVATTSHMLDYTFTNAPVDWYAAQGRWEVAERWTCSPQWGFFAGSASAHPTLWSRYATSGDWTLEAYLATPMDLARGERSPVDLNVTVDADGHDLASGYSFLFGAEKRTKNQVWRGDQKVVNKAFELPKGAGDTHQDWFYVRLERRQTDSGISYRYSVNGQLVAEYTDPKPLPGVLDKPRHIAFWTYNGALSIARVRLWHSGLNSGAVEDRPLSTTRVQTISNDLGEWRPRFEDDQPASSSLNQVADNGSSTVAITNPRSGGDWTTYITEQSFNAKERPRLSFDYRVPKNVRVNLYAQVGGRWREVIFSDTPDDTVKETQSTPDAQKDENAAAITLASDLRMVRNLDPNVTIGQIEGVQTDGQWHSAEFDLLAALEKAGLDTKVDALALAAPSYDYLYAGLGGNHQGATYWIRDFRAPSVGN